MFCIYSSPLWFWCLVKQSDSYSQKGLRAGARFARSSTRRLAISGGALGDRGGSDAIPSSTSWISQFVLAVLGSVLHASMLHAPHSTNMISSEILHFWHIVLSITHFLSLNHGFVHYLTAPTLWIRKKSKSVEQALVSWMEFLWEKSNFQTRVSLFRPKFSPFMPIIPLFHRSDMFITSVSQISDSPANLWSYLSSMIAHLIQSHPWFFALKMFSNRLSRTYDDFVLSGAQTLS